MQLVVLRLREIQPQAPLQREPQLALPQRQELGPQLQALQQGLGPQRAQGLLQAQVQDLRVSPRGQPQT